MKINAVVLNTSRNSYFNKPRCRSCRRTIAAGRERTMRSHPYGYFFSPRTIRSGARWCSCCVLALCLFAQSLEALLIRARKVVDVSSVDGGVTSAGESRLQTGEQGRVLKGRKIDDTLSKEHSALHKELSKELSKEHCAPPYPVGDRSSKEVLQLFSDLWTSKKICPDFGELC